MARVIQITKVAGWVVINDDGKVVPIDNPNEVPGGGTAFRLRAVSFDTSMYIGLSTGGKERADAFGQALKESLVDWKHLLDAEGEEVPFDADLIVDLPFNTLMALGMYLATMTRRAQAEAAARRGNAGSGTSRATKPSGGARTRGSRTATPATD
jgi:hypothetical protein